MEPLPNFPPPSPPVSAKALERFAEKQKRLDELQDKLADMWRLKKVKFPARAWTAKMEAEYKSLQKEATQLENEVSKTPKNVRNAAAAAKSDKEDAAYQGKSRSLGRIEPTQPADSAIFPGRKMGGLKTRRRKHRNGPPRIFRHRASRVSRRKRQTRRS